MVEQTCTADGICTAKPPEDGYIATDYGEAQAAADAKTMEWIAKADKYMHERVSQEKEFERVKNTCQNQHKQCSFWAAIGECEANPKYMKVR